MAVTDAASERAVRGEGKTGEERKPWDKANRAADEGPVRSGCRGLVWINFAPDPAPKPPADGTRG